MILFEPRQGAACPPDSQWYTCIRGPIRGCCLVDPCTTGMCPDEDSNELSSTAGGTSGTTTTTIVMRTTRLPTMTSTLARTTRRTIDQEELASAFNVLASISTSATSSVTISPRSTSTALSVPPPSSQGNTAMIGGIVGGVAALLIMIVAIAYLVYRAKKKQKRFTLLNWRSGPRTKDPIRAIEADEVAYKGQTRSQPSGTAVETITLNTQNAQSTDIPPGPSPTRSLELSARINSPRSLPPTTFPIDTKRGMSSSSTPGATSTTGPSSKGAIYPALSIPPYPSGVHPAFRQRSATTPTSDSTASLMNNFSASSQSPHQTTSELFDTGFYRGRAELSSNPSRELINVPYDERLRVRSQRSLWDSASKPIPVVTSDGAVLAANFNKVPVDPGCHAISFVQFDSPIEPSPPAYRFSWRWSRGGKGKKEKEELDTIRRASTAASLKPGTQSQYQCQRIEENREEEEKEENRGRSC